jgi:hypothetical protein
VRFVVFCDVRDTLFAGADIITGVENKGERKMKAG